jgi:branched-chain amino acid transport system substrate-binding protein
MNKLRRKSRLAVAVCAVAALLLTAGCSGGGSSNSAGADGAALKIGLLTDLSGTFGTDYAGVPDVAQAWTDWINDTKGGVNGRKVELVVKDGQSQPATATAAARELVERDGVAAVFVESGVAQPAVWEYLDSKHVPLLGLNNGTRTPEAPSTFFSTDIGFPHLAQAGAVTAKIDGAGSIASAVCSEVAACQGIGSLLGEFAPKVGVTYEGTVTIAASATSATAQCLEIVNSGAEVVATFLVVVPAQRLIEACKAQGFSGRFLNVAVTQSNFDQLSTSDPVLGVMYDFPWWSDAAPVVEFRKVMQEHEVIDYQSFPSTNLWASLQLFAFALEKNGADGDAAVTGADVTAALRAAVQGVTLDGLLPQPLTFSENGNTEINCFWAIKRDADGKFKTLEGSGPSGNGISGDLASVCV